MRSVALDGKLSITQPGSMSAGPVLCRISEVVLQQKQLNQRASLPRIMGGDGTSAHEISHRLMHRIRHPNRREFAARSNRASMTASRVSFFCRLPGRTGVWLGATTMQSNPRASISRKTLYPYGSASWTNSTSPCRSASFLASLEIASGSSQSCRWGEPHLRFGNGHGNRVLMDVEADAP